jgi:hypothetical protein
MTKERKLALYLILIGVGISTLWAISLARSMAGGSIDFRAIYLGSKTLIEHHDPYLVSDMEPAFVAIGGYSLNFPDPYLNHQLLVLFVNLPTTLFVVAPFTLLPIVFAQYLWIFLEVAGLTVAGILMWNLGAKHSPVLSAWLIGFSLANCENILASGNTAGIVVAFTVIAAWCFLEDRFVAVGIVCMALSLMMKPHDSGLVWLFFLLAGGVFRKRAIQSGIVAACLIIPALVWVSLVAPNWLHEWQANVAAISVPGALNDPRPFSPTSRCASAIISLQSIFSVFISSEKFFNLATYVVGGSLVLVWMAITLRWRMTRERALFALAAIVPLTLLVTYHRVYDAKLLLLTVPACAVLCNSTGAIRWVAGVLTAATLVANSDIPMASFYLWVGKQRFPIDTFSGKILTLLTSWPNPEMLLALGIFYLWVYMRSFRPHTPESRDLAQREVESSRALT